MPTITGSDVTFELIDRIGPQNSPPPKEPGWVERVGSFYSCSKCLAGVTGGVYYSHEEVVHNDSCPTRLPVYLREEMENAARADDGPYSQKLGTASKLIEQRFKNENIIPGYDRPKKRFRLVKKSHKAEDIAGIKSNGKTIHGHEIDISSSSRYIFPIFTGDLPLEQSIEFVRKVAENFKGIFPPDHIIFVPVAKYQDFKLYEIEEVTE